MPGIPWLGSYMFIDEFEYTSNNVTLSTPMPSKYAPGNNVSKAVMIRDIQFDFDQMRLPSAGHSFSLTWSD
jgi:hypothetical protein